MLDYLNVYEYLWKGEDIIFWMIKPFQKVSLIIYHLIANEDSFSHFLLPSWLHALLTVSLREWKPNQLLFY